MFDIIEIEKQRLLKKAKRYLRELPVTITAEPCARSSGGRHDFYSEGDYWWPDPDHPNGPYIRKDGLSNPDNFVAHRQAMVRLSDIIGTFASAYVMTQKAHFAIHAVKHLKAWFIDVSTRMNPNLLYGQAIKGRHTGRSIGVIDTIHLVEVARGAKLLCAAPQFSEADQSKVKNWFHTYLDWLNRHPYGQTEKEHPNNHGVCWALQAAAFADFVGNKGQLATMRQQFKTVFVEQMMAENGSFPAELERTKPYGYSLFIIDAMAGVAQLASTPEDDLWTFELPDGRGMHKGVSFIAPYIKNKGAWPLPADVMYWDEWPVRHMSLLLAGVQFQNEGYLATWQQLEADPKTFEVLRNLPLRHPLLWVKTT
ncbi:MAG: alginate lyase family protein [Anaerolineae bacterium]